MSSVLHRNLNAAPSLAQHGGAFSVEGFLDLSSGAGVTPLGNNNASVKAAMTNQIEQLPYAHASAWTTPAAEELADRLLAFAGPSFSGGRVMFLNGGGEAVEAACKLAVQHLRERDGHFRHPVQFIGCQNSYHGNSFFTLALGDHPRKERYHGELSSLQLRMSRCDVKYHPRSGYFHDERLSKGGTLYRLRTLLDRNVERGIRSVVVVETIGGMASGINPLPKPVLESIVELCRAAGALLIYDEVLCGNYRTGWPFAWQRFGNELAPDIVVMGKGLAAGYFPLSAVVANGTIIAPIKAGSGRLWHSTTNQNHPVGCAAALAALDEYQKIDYPALFAVFKDYDAATQNELKPLHKWNMPLHGVGTLWGLRLPTEQLYDFNVRLHREGIVVYSDPQTIKPGVATVLIAPPYTLQPEELYRALHLVETAYNASLVA